MDEYEVAERASTLPDRYAARVSADTLEGLRLMDEGGEYGELASELTAALAKNAAEVSAAEQRELRALLEATGMPTDRADQLTVRD
jgi:hypothetical protein